MELELLLHRVDKEKVRRTLDEGRSVSPEVRVVTSGGRFGVQEDGLVFRKTQVEHILHRRVEWRMTLVGEKMKRTKVEEVVEAETGGPGGGQGLDMSRPVRRSRGRPERRFRT